MGRDPDGPSPSDLRDWAEMDDEINGWWKRSACRCGGDMPGRCPGPRNCPMCADDDDMRPEQSEEDSD